MKVFLIAVITSTFISLAYSLTCYQCVPEMTANCTSYNTEECAKHQTKLTCPKGMDFCMWTHVRGIDKGVGVDAEKRSCASNVTCGSLKTSCDWHHSNTSLTCKWSCCDSDLCNGGGDANSCPIAHWSLLAVLACLFVSL